MRYQSGTTTPQLVVSQAAVEAGKTYEITVVVSQAVSGGLKIEWVGNSLSFNTVGVHRAILTAGSNSVGITRTVANVDITIDSISVRELPGNHASQPTATSRPVLSARVNLLTNTVFSGAVAGTPGVAPTGWSFNSTGGTTVSANDGIIVFSATNARQMIGVSVTLPANTTQTWSVRIEANPNSLPFSQLFFAVNATEAVAQYRANGINVGVTSYVPAAGDTLSITLINGATQITPIFRIGVGTSRRSRSQYRCQSAAIPARQYCDGLRHCGVSPLSAL